MHVVRVSAQGNDRRYPGRCRRNDRSHRPAKCVLPFRRLAFMSGDWRFAFLSVHGRILRQPLGVHPGASRRNPQH